MRNGIADVAGLEAAVRRAFSRRRAEIEAEMARHGATSAGAAQVAALATRRTKDYRVTPERLAPEWRDRAAALGLDYAAVRATTGRAHVRELANGEVDELLSQLAGANGLTSERSRFCRRDVPQALAGGLPAGADIGIDELERISDRFLALDRVVVLADGEPRRELTTFGGRTIQTVPTERRYSTPELLERERRVLDYARDSVGARRDVVRASSVEHALWMRPTIAGEQAEMVRRLVLDGDGVAVVIGQAGTGKTFALAAARQAWEGSGYRVVGAALARRAAIELEDGAGIESTSIATLLDELRRRPWSALPRRSVLVIDEAGMVPTRALAEIVDHVDRCGAKLVLVGDDRQLPEIGAGGTFGALARELPAIELRENRRQAAAWEREALAVLREGDADGAVQRYAARGRIFADVNADEVRRRLVADWWATRSPDDAVMIAHRRRDVADLNGRAHEVMRAASALSGLEISVGDVLVATGDRVLLRRDDRRLGVVNGDRGVVVEAGENELVVELRGRTVRLGREYLDQERALELGYAITGHAAQGLTCSQTFVLATDGLSKEWAYVALSRGRESNRLYVTHEARESAEFAPNGDGTWRPAEALREGLSRSAAHELATARQRRSYGLER